MTRRKVPPTSEDESFMSDKALTFRFTRISRANLKPSGLTFFITRFAISDVAESMSIPCNNQLHESLITCSRVAGQGV
jgi:hypothetical protein